MKYALPLAALAFALSGCGGATGDGNAAAPAAPVAGAAAPAGQDWTQTVSQTPEGGFRMGNPDAPIKLVEYGSRTCPTCGQFGRDATRPLEDNYVKTGKVSYEFREFLVHGSPDLPPALLGRCVGTAAFFPVLEAMYVNQQQFEEKLTDQAATSALQTRLAGANGPAIANAWADYMGYVDFMKQRGLPEAKARQCLNNQAEIDRITKVMQDASTNLNVTGTPSFFINGKQFEGAPAWSEVEKGLKAAGA